MPILEECVTGNLTHCLYTGATEMIAAGFGGQAVGYLLFYLFIVLFTAIVIGIFRNSVMFGSFTGIIAHMIIMVLGLANALPMPATYYYVGNFVGLMLIGAMYWAWKNGT